MSYIRLFICLFYSLTVMGQAMPSADKKLNAKLDSILVEGNLLYSYEIATWISCDLAMGNPSVSAKFESYLTYQTGKAIKTIILGAHLEKCVAEYTFITDYDTPDYSILEERSLTTYEKKLIYARERIISNIYNGAYGVVVPEGFSLNFVLLPFGKIYKMYILTGTSQRDIIPFGNDYLFIADEYGNIEKWRKFHAGFLPQATMHDGHAVIQMSHSHLKSNPLISATDICTFMLYAPLYHLEQFSVYSDGRYMEYNLTNNTIQSKLVPSEEASDEINVILH